MKFHLLLLILIVSGSTWAQKPPSWFKGKYKQLIQFEHSNSYEAKDSEVNESYQAKNLYFFKLPYLLIPQERLITETADGFKQILMNHFYKRSGQKRYIRFFIHPESMSLYQPLINEFGISGHYDAIATSSTRTLLAADPERPNVDPVFIKLSLAKKQDRLGRIVPSWEIRRSVRNTTQLVSSDEIPSANTTKAALSIVPEVAGAHLKSTEGLGYYIDEDQKEVFDHGFILRDASFINAPSDTILIPMFWLFSSQGSDEPPIIQYWKIAKLKRPQLSLDEFYAETVIRPFVKHNLQLMIRHGVFPQFHSQNVLLRINRNHFKVESIIHRDIGSFKTDLKLRWIHGLDTDQYRSPLADKDFGLSWGSEKLWPYFEGYFHRMNYQSYMTAYKKVSPSFRASRIEALLLEEVFNQMTDLLNLSMNSNSPNIMLQMWLDRNPPDSIRETTRLKMTDLEWDIWSRERNSKLQEIQLPTEWQGHLIRFMSGQKYRATKHGLLRLQRINGEKQVSLVLYDKKDLRLISPDCKQILSKKAG